MSETAEGERPKRGGANLRRAVRARERLELAAVLGHPVDEGSWRHRLERLDDDAAETQREHWSRAQAAVAKGMAAVRVLADERPFGGLTRVKTSGGASIVRVQAETFPGHVNYCYALEVDGERVLWDVGTGHNHSRSDITLGLEAAGVLFNLDFALPRFDVVSISHGHIDHFGDVGWFKEQTGGALWVHELDARVLEHWEERVIISGRDVRDWLGKTGVSAERADELTAMYLSSKSLYASDGVVVDRRLRHGQSLFKGRGRVIHTPGHCPGHVCLHLDDALLVADQVLNPVTPHISPQALHPQCGIERYLSGLARLRLLKGVEHVLPAHYDPVPDLGERIDAIAHHHAERSVEIARFCEIPRTIKDVAREVYGTQSGYHVLLAVQEAGAHVEYLHQVGGLVIANLDELTEDPRAPVRYQAAEAAADWRVGMTTSGEGLVAAD